MVNLLRRNVVRLSGVCNSITDISGKLILTGEQEGDLITLHLGSLEPGWYLLNLTRSHKSEYFKILKSL